MTLNQRFADAMGQLLGPDFPTDVALAVSGGGDSMAMLTLAHNWAHRWGVKLWVVTVDHGLRSESAEEAAMVAEECATLGHPHATLRWHWDGLGNKMDAARRGRLDLINRWRGVIAHVLMAHTSDDVAETFLMRLKRGSGVEGLSAMKANRAVRPVGKVPALRPEDCLGDLPPQGVPAKGTLVRPANFTVIRPCLEMSRAELRHYLTTLKGRWVEDPSNDDPTYDRARIRKLLADEGIDTDALVATAKRMARAKVALRARAAEVWSRIGQEGKAGTLPTGDLLFEREGFEEVERDTQMRLLSAALQYVSSAYYRPRADALETLLDRALGGGGGTLNGCELRMERDTLRVFREHKAVSKTVGTIGASSPWDTRWRVFHNDLKGMAIRALGEDGWAQIPDKPERTPPFHAARSLPSIWDGERLVACDAMSLGPGNTTRFWPMGREMYGFKAFLLSH